MTPRTLEIHQKMETHNTKSLDTKRRMQEARDKRLRKAAKKKAKKAGIDFEDIEDIKTDDLPPLGEAPSPPKEQQPAEPELFGTLSDLSTLVAEIEAEAFEFDVPMGDRTAREAMGQVDVGSYDGSKPSHGFITMDAIAEDGEEGENVCETGSPDVPMKPRRYSLSDIVGTHAEEDRRALGSENEVFARLFAEAAERAEMEAQEALAEMGKEEKKVRKGMEKLGMVPLDGLQQVRVTLADGSVTMIKLPEVYVLPRHPTNPGPDRVVFFGSNVNDDYDSDEPLSPQHSSPQQGTISGLARTLLGKHLQEDHTVQDVANVPDDDWEQEEVISMLGLATARPGPMGEPGDVEALPSLEEGEESDSLPPSPVHHLSPVPRPQPVDDEVAKKENKPPKAFTPPAPRPKASPSPVPAPVAAPMMTARTQENIEKLEDLAAFAESLSPTHNRAQEEQILSPTGMFTARDFMHSDVDPATAAHLAEEAARKREEQTLAAMSPEDRAAVRAAQMS